jgi:hypothetical protein
MEDRLALPSHHLVPSPEVTTLFATTHSPIRPPRLDCLIHITGVDKVVSLFTHSHGSLEDQYGDEIARVLPEWTL